MEISHFTVCPREKKRIPFLFKGYRQGNIGVDALLCIQSRESAEGRK